MTETLFACKKIISAILAPFGIVVVVLLAGILVWARGYRRLAFAIMIGCVGWLIFASMPIVALLLIQPLELRAGPYADPPTLRQKGVRYIVVLAGGSLDPRLSPADRQGAGIFRFMEGYRLWQQLPESQLVLSGQGYPPGRTPKALMEELPRALGIPKERLHLENRAWDTEDEAALLSQIASGYPFVLVTSAYHMPRAIQHFKRVGADPIPAPCEFTSTDYSMFYDRFVPSPVALKLTHLAVHEYLGLAWLFIKNTLGLVVQPAPRAGQIHFTSQGVERITKKFTVIRTIAASKAFQGSEELTGRSTPTSVTSQAIEHNGANA